MNGAKGRFFAPKHLLVGEHLTSADTQTCASQTSVAAFGAHDPVNDRFSHFLDHRQGDHCSATKL